jgi:acyl-CoA synthetase (NDP forming)
LAHRLAGLIAPRAIAMVGASERNHYTRLAMRAADAIGFDGRLHLVNRRGIAAFGRPTATSCAAIGEPVDTAYLCVPVDGVLEAAEEAIAAGIPNLVVLAGGFAEIPGVGVAREAALAELCARSGTRVLGPNCLGYRNMVARVAIGSIPDTPQPVAGRIAIVSASGSVATQVANYGIQQGTGFTHVIATGNEMNVSTADLIDYLVELPEVRAVALFMETVKDAAAFAAAAGKARAARKPIVVLKAGKAEATAAVAAAHTGAVVGDDRVFDAACERLGVVRVATIEALANTAAAIAATGPLERPGVALVSISGGVCEIASDLAETAGVRFPPFAPETQAALGTVLSDLGQMHNPLDLTGAAVRDETMWTSVPAIVARDPGIGLTLLNWDVPILAEPPMPNTVRLIGEALAAAEAPALMIGNFARPLNDHGLAFAARHGIDYTLPGIGEGLAAAGRLVWWSARMRRPAPPAPPAIEPAGERPSGERQTLAFLAGRGVPVVPQALAASVGEAVRIAREIGGPVALKILSPDIAHKSDMGGVALGLAGDRAIEAAFAAILAAAAERAPDAAIEGVLVAPMRTGGLELLVGVARDPVWGPVLAVGLGGIWVELLKDTALCLLPAPHDEIVRALRSLRAAALFDGYRGAPPVDLDALAGVIARIGAAAIALGPDCAALEVNPLWVRGDHIEALDALAVCG